MLDKASCLVSVNLVDDKGGDGDGVGDGVDRIVGAGDGDGFVVTVRENDEKFAVESQFCIAALAADKRIAGMRGEIEILKHKVPITITITITIAIITSHPLLPLRCQSNSAIANTPKP